jgi:hypothetical protein
VLKCIVCFFFSPLEDTEVRNEADVVGDSVHSSSQEPAVLQVVPLAQLSP